MRTYDIIPAAFIGEPQSATADQSSSPEAAKDAHYDASPQNVFTQTRMMTFQTWRLVFFLFLTHSHVINGHPHGPVVVDLFRRDGLGLVRQEDAQQQQQPLVSINHPCRKSQGVRGKSVSNTFIQSISSSAFYLYVYGCLMAVFKINSSLINEMFKRASGWMFRLSYLLRLNDFML